MANGEMPLLGWGWAALFWAAVAPTVPVRRLRREHPDLYAAHRLHGTELRRHDTGHDAAAHARKLQRRAQAKARGRAFGLVAAVLVLAAAGTAYVLTQVRPPSLGERLEAFRAAWRSGPEAEFRGFFPASRRQEEGERFRRSCDRRGWQPSPPALEVPEFTEGETRGGATFAMAGAGALRTAWEVQDGSWRLVELDCPPPPIEPLAADLERAWNASDFAGVAAFYREDRHAKAEGSRRRLAERRGWQPALPRALRHRIRPTPNPRRVEVFLDLPEGELRFLLAFVDDVWEVASLKPPEE